MKYVLTFQRHSPMGVLFVIYGQGQAPLILPNQTLSLKKHLYFYHQGSFPLNYQRLDYI